MSAAACFQVAVMGCRIAASSDCPESAAVLDRYFFPSLLRSSDPSEDPHLRIRIDRTDSKFRLFVNDAFQMSASQPIHLVPELIRNIDQTVLLHLNGFWAVHAGAVQWGDQVLLLPGGTHTGKSSLVAELLRRRASYFSDEYALIDSEGRAHPYPRPLLIRDGGSEQVPVAPDDYGAMVATSPARIGWILSLIYEPGGSWDVAAIPQSEGVITLLQNTPHILADTPGMMDSFQRAAADAKCHSGKRPSAEHAADAILEVLESGS